MIKLAGILMAFTLCAGVWLGACGTIVILAEFLQLYGARLNRNSWLWLGFILIGLISYGLIQLVEKYYPTKYLNENANKSTDLTNY